MVNAETVYEDGDADCFGDIDILVCINCDYTWQRYGRFDYEKSLDTPAE